MAKPKTKPTNRADFNQAEGSPHCCECGAHTPYLYHGKRYCPNHHPNPSAHIKPPKRGIS